jgi:hypothetical protein
VTNDLRDVKAQQMALGVSLIYLKQQVQGPGDGASTHHTSDPSLPGTGNGSVALPPPGGRSHKIEFPKFNGACDPLPWLNCCERYFSLCGMPTDRRVQVASFYLLDDDQVWYHRVELNSEGPSWNRFVQLNNTRFGPPLTESPIDELALLSRDGTIEDYCAKFMVLSCRDPAISEDHQVQLFTMGLSH